MRRNPMPRNPTPHNPMLKNGLFLYIILMRHFHPTPIIGSDWLPNWNHSTGSFKYRRARFFIIMIKLKYRNGWYSTNYPKITSWLQFIYVCNQFSSILSLNLVQISLWMMNVFHLIDNPTADKKKSQKIWVWH